MMKSFMDIANFKNVIVPKVGFLEYRSIAIHLVPLHANDERLQVKVRILYIIYIIGFCFKIVFKTRSP